MTQPMGSAGTGLRNPIWLLALLAAMLSLQLSLGVCVQEDAFISFRYAQNLVEGHGLVYNPGEPVEGYTNFLWTLFVAVGMGLGIDPVPLSRFGGMASGVALLLLVFGFARNDDADRRVTGGLVAAALVALAPAVISESVQGLETVFFALLVTAGVLMTVRGRRLEASNESGALRALALGTAVTALSAMTRPEGVGVFALALMGAAVWRWREGGRLLARSDLFAVVIFLLIYLPYWLWRFNYYGYPLPNTFYAKTGVGIAAVWSGLDYEWKFLTSNPVLLLLTLWAIYRGIIGRRKDGQAGPKLATDPLFTTAGIVVLGYLLYVISVGGDFKATFRFIVPVLPLWAILVDGAISRNGWPLGALRQWRFGQFVPWVVLLAIVLSSMSSIPKFRQWAEERSWDLQRRTLCGKYLASYADPGDTLAIHSAGIIPFYSGLETIDMWGLSDLHIAHRKMPDKGRRFVPGHFKVDDGYAFARQPTYFVDEQLFVSERPVQDLARRVFRGSRFLDRYETRNVPLDLSDVPRSAPLYFNFVELKR